MNDRFKVVIVKGAYAVRDTQTGVVDTRRYKVKGWAANRADKLAELALRTALGRVPGLIRQP